MGQKKLKCASAFVPSKNKWQSGFRWYKPTGRFGLALFHIYQVNCANCRNDFVVLTAS